MRLLTPLPRPPREQFPECFPARPKTRAAVLARIFIDKAGRICPTRRREWWGDLIYAQEVQGEAALGRAAWCLLFAPVLGWPELRLRLVAGAAAAIYDISFGVVRLTAFFALQVARWSPAGAGASLGLLAGVLLQIRSIGDPNIAWVVVTTGAGLYFGRTYPKELLRLLGTAGGTVLGMLVGQEVAGSMSLPLFATPGMIFGGAFGEFWAMCAREMQAVSGAEVATLVLNATMSAGKSLAVEFRSIRSALPRAVGAVLRYERATPQSTVRAIVYAAPAARLLPLAGVAPGVTGLQGPFRSAPGRAVGGVGGGQPSARIQQRLPASARRRLRRDKQVKQKGPE